MSLLSKPYFHDEAAAFEHVEKVLWSDGQVCSHCGSIGGHYKLKGVRTKASKKNPEGLERHGLYKCVMCTGQFTVRQGTIFEESHLPLHKWLQAIHLMCSSKKGISAHQMGRTLEITYKTAWFLCHRIRESMRPAHEELLGGKGKAVEADETFLGRKRGAKIKTGVGHKFKVLSLVERGGTVRSRVLKSTNKKEIAGIVRANIDRESNLMTDTAGYYKRRDIGFENHQTVNHLKDEYVRGEVYTNTLEGYFSLFKRGMRGVYQHCREKHLHRYLAEFDFRYNNRVSLGVNDDARAVHALQGIVGKRLTYAG